MSTCRSCCKDIIWSETASGKKIPIDPEPVPSGNIMLECHGALATVVAPRPDVKRHVSHFATCPNASSHRKRK